VGTPTSGHVDTPTAARKPAGPRVHIQLFGGVTILDRDGGPVRGLRQHARQLLVYLAVHRNGADLPQIMEVIWPDATLRRAGERLQTEVGDLRGRIRQAAGNEKIQPVLNTGGHYVLNADLVDVDVWQLTDALRRAAAATEPAARIAALHTAVDAHTGALSQGFEYEWIEQPGEQLRRHGIRARLQLADLVAGTDPRHAADLAQAAAALDPYNEDVARQAMRALARAGDAAGVRAQLRRLRDTLPEIEEEPSAETIALAAQLQREITGTGRRPGGEHPTDDPPGERQ
jgi:DNA-binding SARP family transcriptional activator